MIWTITWYAITSKIIFLLYNILQKKYYRSTFLFSMSKSQVIIFKNIFNESAINGNANNLYYIYYGN